jgi:hypothetical protein
VNGRRITTKEATIKTATVEIKALTINGKQVTQSVFRQLLNEPLLDPQTGELRRACLYRDGREDHRNTQTYGVQLLQEAITRLCWGAMLARMSRGAHCHCQGVHDESKGVTMVLGDYREALTFAQFPKEGFTEWGRELTCCFHWQWEIDSQPLPEGAWRRSLGGVSHRIEHTEHAEEAADRAQQEGLARQRWCLERLAGLKLDLPEATEEAMVTRLLEYQHDIARREQAIREADEAWARHMTALDALDHLFIAA